MNQNVSTIESDKNNHSVFLTSVFKWPNNQVTWKVMGYTRQLGGASQRYNLFTIVIDQNSC